MAKYTDMREVTITVSNGDEDGYVVFSHGLTDGDGNTVDPDSVNTEIVGTSGTSVMPASTLVFRPSTAIGIALGLTAGQIAIFISKATNATGSDQIYTVRVTSEYIHSIQSNDHTA